MKKTAFISGASRGIGEKTAEKFAKAGYDLYLNCIKSEEKLKNLADNLSKEYGVSCTVLVGDVGDPETVKKFFEGIERIDVLVNNAGIAHIGLLQDMSFEEWSKVMSTNLDSVFLTSKYAIPLMLRAGQGRIINVSSVWGNVGGSMEVAYSASKGAINSFTKALARELAPSNIQVNAVAFGTVDTQMNHCFSKDEVEALIDEIPAGRFATVEEAADLILQVSNAPAYLNGQIITMDGAWT